MSEKRMIGDILLERRKRLGLSVERVASDTKLQRRTIEAFERSDFDAMPPKGYAQATLASYARYLGLEPEDVLRVYEDELYHYQRELRTAAHPDRSRGEYAPPRPERTRRSSSAGPSHASSSSPWGESDARRRADDLYGSEPRRQRPRDYGYASEPPTRERERVRSERELRSDGPARDAGRTSRAPRDGEVRETREGAYAVRGSQTSRGRAEGRRATGVVSLDDGYQGGSGGRGQSEPRRGGAARDAAAGDQMAELREALSGALRGVAGYLSSNRNVTFVLAAVVALLVVILLVFAVTSCASRPSGSSADGTIPVSTVGGQASSSATGAASSAASGTQTQTQTQATQAQTASEPLAGAVDLQNLPGPSTVTFAVDAQASACPWVEVTVDGTRLYAQRANPGETQSYTIGSSATITVSDPASVAFTVNGTPVQASVANGTGTLTCTVAADQQTVVDQTATTPAATEEAPAEDASGEQAAEQPAEQATEDAAAYDYTGNHQSDVAGSVQVLYDENGQGYYLDANGDVNYYYDDGTPVT